VVFVMYVPGNSKSWSCVVILVRHVYPHTVCGNLKTTLYLQCWFVVSQKPHVRVKWDKDSYWHGLGLVEKTLDLVESGLW